MNYYGFVSLFNGLVALTLGLAVLLKNRKNPLYISFAVFSVSIALWAILYAVWQSQHDRPSALFFIRAAMAPCYFIPFGFLWFSQNITEDHPKDSHFPVYFLVPVFFGLASFSPWMIKDVAPRLYFPYWPVPGVLMHLCFVVFNSAVVYAYCLLFKSWANAAGTRRWQLKLVTITTLAMWLGGSTNWFLWYNIPIPPIPNFFVAISLLILAYAIMRCRLFDIDALAEMVHEATLSALGLLASSLNHELRNPLYIVKGKIESHLDAVERNIFPSAEEEARQSRAMLATAHAQLERAMDIMKRFSDFAKPFGLGTGDREKVLLKDVFADVLQLVSNECQMQKIKVAEVPENGLCVQANRRQLEEIFFNLIVNACHAMGDQGGELAIRAHQPNGKVVVEIADTGPGIAKENHHRIFEPFYTTKEAGTGLGLYITKQLVERNGGKISVRSRPGRGTKFILEFKANGDGSFERSSTLSEVL